MTDLENFNAGMETTTNWEELKNGGRFTWGQIIAFHEIGVYRIAEFHPHQTRGCEVLRSIDFTKVNFHGWINNSGVVENTCRVFRSLDEALVGLISYRREGCNGRAAVYFMAALDNLSPEK